MSLLQVECNECSRWVHATCEGIDQAQYDAMTLGTHPIWVSTGRYLWLSTNVVSRSCVSACFVMQGNEYLCPLCRVKISKALIRKLREHDKIGMFAEPVTERVARNYYDIIRNPMDMATMTSKATR
jgi:hypothetical protein